MIVVATRLEALGNPTRLAIYHALVRAGAAGLPVGKLQERLAIPASTLSHHLAKLCACDLVSQTRESTVLRCRANYQVMRDLVGALADECCADATCGTDAEDASAAA